MNKANIRNAILSILLLGTLLSACEKEDSDTEYPTIDVTTAEAFPQNCSEINRGEAFTAKIVVSDNQELGSLSVDIHHNFDHHTHSTEVTECDLAPIKTPVNPLTQIVALEIPPGLKQYTAIKEIEIPSDIDTGDYHFMIRLTDKEGWQTIKGLSIKIKD